MHNIDLLLTLAGGLGAALAFGYLTHRIGLSPIVGYLLAGIAVGPATPGFVADREMAEQLAEVGVILLMFGVGLQFHFKELLAVRRVAIPGALFQSAVATVLGAMAVVATGGGWSAGVVYGLAVSVASTVVLVRVLSDQGDLHSPAGHVAVGWLVVEDLFTVLVLVLLPLAFPGGDAAPREGAGAVALEVALALLKVAGLVAFTFVVGQRAIPWVLARIARTQSRELFTLTILVVALGIAVGSAKVFGVSMALGAFLAGMVVGRSEFSLRAASEALPMRDAFAVLFFVSVGMLFDPSVLWASPGLVLLTLLVVLAGKPLAAFAITALLGHPSRTGLSVAAALAQIGEFSFILATAATQLGVVSLEANHALVATALLTISINPLVYRSVRPMEAWLAARPGLWRLLNRRAAALQDDGHRHDLPPAYRAVIVGYGPVGRTLARLLREQGIEPEVIEMNLDTVEQLRADGIRVHYGDAALRTTLEQAGVATAGNFVLSVAGIPGAEEVIRLAREIRPSIHVLARVNYLSDIPALRQAGAHRVFAGEGEVALAMAESVLHDLGATPDQIDRERERVHEELF